MSKEVAMAPVIAAIAFAPNIPTFDKSVSLSVSISISIPISISITVPRSPSARLRCSCPLACLSRPLPLSLPSPISLGYRVVYAYSASTFPKNPALDTDTVDAEGVLLGLLGPASGQVYCGWWGCGRGRSCSASGKRGIDKSGCGIVLSTAGGE